MAEFGRDFLGGKTARTARERVKSDGIPYQLDHGHVMVKLSDAEAWRRARTVSEPIEVNSLKSLIARAAEKARRMTA
jgi:hypothetical protein